MIAPNAKYVAKWRDEDYSPATDAAIEGFLREWSAKAALRTVGGA